MHARHQSTHTPTATALGVAVARLSREGWTPEQARALISRLLDATGLDYDQRVEVLGGSLVSEAVRPYWESGLSATEAHGRLAGNDPELAEVVEAVSTVLLARAEAQDDARADRIPRDATPLSRPFARSLGRPANGGGGAAFRIRAPHAPLALLATVDWTCGRVGHHVSACVGAGRDPVPTLG
jgi:hypothetical protein